MNDITARLRRPIEGAAETIATAAQINAERAFAADELERLERKIALKNAVITQHVTDLSKLRDFAGSLLDPERLGYAVRGEIRDAARQALGLPAVETTRVPMTSFNEGAAKRDALTWPRGSMGEDITEGSAT